MIYVHWLILTIYFTAILITMLAVLMDNKQPSKTMAWILVLFFLPLLGIIFYFFRNSGERNKYYFSTLFNF
jgi:cardiolipin synthase